MKNLLDRIWAIRRRRPFRGLRRAAASHSSPISCCSSACSATHPAGSLLVSHYPYPRTHSTVMVIPGSRAASGPQQAGPQQQSMANSLLLLDEDDQLNNNSGASNEQLVLHFPHLPSAGYEPTIQAISNNNEGECPSTAAVQLGEQQRQSVVSQYGFQTHRPRPPLNRAIPPIPESRSNESIQSNGQSRRQSDGNGNGAQQQQQLQQQTVLIIDENNPIDAGPMEMGESMLLMDEGGGAEEGEEEAGKEQGDRGKKGGKRSRLPKLMRRKEKKQEEKKESATHGTTAKCQPKSPLLSVAHSVKNRLSRIAGGGGSSSKAKVPMSRSLEIGGGGQRQQQSRIPQALAPGDPMHKSWSMDSGQREREQQQQDVPRRMPATTLIPSPGIGPRRLPPDEQMVTAEWRGDSVKQVQFAAELEVPNRRCEELKRAPELAFVWWTPPAQMEREEQQQEEEEKGKKRKTEAKEKEKKHEEERRECEEEGKEKKEEEAEGTKREREIERAKTPPAGTAEPLVREITIQQQVLTVRSVPSARRDRTLSPAGRLAQLPPVTPQLAVQAPAVVSAAQPKSPPAQLRPPLTLLRKSPQSFPPMGPSTLGMASAAISSCSSPQSVRGTKSAMSVSFGPSDVHCRRKTETECGGGIGRRVEEDERHGERQGKRRVFSTRSLRLVATRVYESSPLLVRRRGRSAGRATAAAEADKPQKRDESTCSLRFFRKSHSIPNDDNNNNNDERMKSAGKGGEAKANKKAAQREEAVKLRSVKSVHLERFRRATGQKSGGGLEAPLAETESSRVGNSPAVEQCPPWEQPLARINEGGGQQQKSAAAGNQASSRRGFLQNVRLCKKTGAETVKERHGEGKAKEKSPAVAQQPNALIGSNRLTLAQLLASPVPRKKPAQQDSAGTRHKGLIDDEIGDQPMLITTAAKTTAAAKASPLGADFRLIDEPGSSTTSSAVHSRSRQQRPTGTAEEDGASSVLLVAEQRGPIGPGAAEVVSVQMLQRRMQTGLTMAAAEPMAATGTNTRKRNARSRSDPKQQQTSVPEATKANGHAQQQQASISGTCPAKRPHDEEMPWADESVKSEDGASLLLPVLSDFRNDLVQLRDTVQRDLEELETLRLQNIILKEQLAERDRVIEQLQRQLRNEGS